MNKPDLPALDASVLDELLAAVEGDRAFVVDLIEAYLADGVTHVAEIESALVSADATAVVRPAHTLKSSSATVGATQLAATARALELAGRAGALEEVGDDAASLRTAWDQAATALRAWVGDGDGR
ncbi:MAG: Hpt domain-containing protein [Candidatus Limnocylindria bacterium]